MWFSINQRLLGEEVLSSNLGSASLQNCFKQIVSHVGNSVSLSVRYRQNIFLKKNWSFKGLLWCLNELPCKGNWYYAEQSKCATYMLLCTKVSTRDLNASRSKATMYLRREEGLIIPQRRSSRVNKETELDLAYHVNWKVDETVGHTGAVVLRNRGK